MVVDYQTHWHPRAYLNSIEERRSYPRTERTGSGYLYQGPHGNQRLLGDRFIDLDAQLADMDRYGVDVMVCSPSLLGEVASLEVSEAGEATHLLNDEMARAQREHPTRFVGLAMLPMQDTSAALEVLDTAVTSLGLRGVCMVSHINGRPMASEQTLPVYQRIEQLGVPIFIHPAQISSVYQDGEARPLEAGLNWVHDTSKAALSLILSGTLDVCPRLTVVHPHAGGTLPYVIGRIADSTRQASSTVERPAEIALPVAQYLRDRFYADSVSHTPGALQLAIKTYGLQRILLATDYPWQPREERLAYVRQNATDGQIDAIFNRNLLPQLVLPATARNDSTAGRPLTSWVRGQG